MKNEGLVVWFPGRVAIMDTATSLESSTSLEDFKLQKLEGYLIPVACDGPPLVSLPKIQSFSLLV